MMDRRRLTVEVGYRNVIAQLRLDSEVCVERNRIAKERMAALLDLYLGMFRPKP